MLKWLLPSPLIVSADGIDIDQMDSALTRELAAMLARTGVPTFHRTLPRLRAELDRARRYQRPFTLALIGDSRVLNANPAITDTAQRSRALAPGSPLIPVLIAPILAEITRDIDIVTYASTLEKCALAMPEAGGAQAENAIHRFAQICSHRLRVPVHARRATFPEDGLTIEELLRKASSLFEHAVMISGNGTSVIRPALSV
jgi:GGDEF domain-containing protein